MQTTGISFFLGAYQSAVINALEKMRRDNIAARIWANDFPVWKPTPEEISNRLGWLHAPVETLANVNSIRASLEPFTNGSIEDVVLLGMGGSSLSAEVFNKIFGSAPGFPIAYSGYNRSGLLFPACRKTQPGKNSFSCFFEIGNNPGNHFAFSLFL